MLKIEEPRVSREPIVKMLTIKAFPGGDTEDNSVSSTNAWVTLGDNQADPKARYLLTTINIGFQMFSWS